MSAPANTHNLVRSLRGSPGTLLTLTHYAAGERQARHEHDHTQVSFLLAGGIAETIGSRCHEVLMAGACIKLAGVDHENIWGNAGALMLTAKLKGVDAETFAALPLAAWQGGAAPDRRLIRTLFAASSASAVDDIVLDLIGSVSRVDQSSHAIPDWLRRVSEALWDGELSSANEAARLAGVHRVHFSRAFSRHMGVPFSTYRRHVILSRAVERAVRTKDRLAEVAAAAGFADQSHMNRSIGAALGTSPLTLRRSLTRSA